MEQLTTIQIISVSILPIIFAITVHEVAHGYVAYFLGDKTPKALGRLTLNPIKHIDLIGTIIVPLLLLFLGGIIIGWAKPVPVNARHLKKPKRDLALIAAAGPGINLLMSLLWAGIAKLGMVLMHYNLPGAQAIYYMGAAGIDINVILAILNLIPLPPLDGGHIVMGLLPRKLALKYDKITPFGFFIILFLLALGVVGYVIGPVIRIVGELIRMMFGI